MADGFLEKHISDLMIVTLSAMILGTLLILVPKLLRAHARTQEMLHAEHLKALENGQPLPPFDVRSRAAGRTAALVPMIAVCAAAAVTCFLVVYKPDYLFAVSVAVWAVAGIVSLAAITGGVALLGRLAQLDAGVPDEEEPVEDGRVRG
jgi:hypothetical protein